MTTNSLPGRVLGRYRIVEELSRGGMGVVYRAEDTTLHREVALKLLPPELTADPERKRRFLSEAQTASRLEHPHIGVIYEVGEAEGVSFIAMELIRGEPLRDVLRGGRLFPARAVELTIEVAEGLALAHERSVVHRDLKPANVMVTEQGHAKIIDFGLAKLVTALSGDADATTAALTHPGVVVGTTSYMSPEQARGQVVDARSDTFSLGVMLYEMLAGQRPFGGHSELDTINGILHQATPPLPRLDPHVSREATGDLQRLVEKCLAKDPAERYQGMRDLVVDLRAARRLLQASATPEPVLTRRVPIPVWALVSAVAAFVLLAGLAGWSYRTRQVTGSDPRSVASSTHAMIELRPAEQLGRKYMGVSGVWVSSVRPGRTEIAVSPSGRLVVFSGTKGDLTQLYSRPLDRTDAIPIPGTEGGHVPFFSPDGQSVGFWADAKLKSVPVAGGAVSVICEAADGYNGQGIMGASWSDRDTIVFQRNTPPYFFSVPSRGSTAGPLARFDAASRKMRAPHFLPGGDVMLFTSVIQAGSTAYDWPGAKIEAFWLKTGDRQTILESGSDARYVPTGHLLYVRSGKLMAVPFDAIRVKTTGEPVVVIDSVMVAIDTPNLILESGTGQFAVSKNGVLVYARGGVHPENVGALYWVDRNGTEQELLHLPKAAYVSPRLSPNGRELLYSSDDPVRRQRELWRVELSTGIARRLTYDGDNRNGVWSPDGSRVVFAHSSGSSSLNLSLMSASGLDQPEGITNDPAIQTPIAWSATSNVVAFLQDSEIWTLPIEGKRVPVRFRKKAPFGGLSYPEFSPDGHWLAYVSSESGRNEVYVTAYPGPGESRQLSVNGGSEPVWNPKGRELFYRSGRQVLSVRTDANWLMPRVPEVLFEGDFSSSGPFRSWDIDPNGRFLMSRLSVDPTDRPVTELNLVENWFQELIARAPARR